MCTHFSVEVKAKLPICTQSWEGIREGEGGKEREGGRGRVGGSSTSDAARKEKNFRWHPVIVLIVMYLQVVGGAAICFSLTYAPFHWHSGGDVHLPAPASLTSGTSLLASRLWSSTLPVLRGKFAAKLELRSEKLMALYRKPPANHQIIAAVMNNDFVLQDLSSIYWMPVCTAGGGKRTDI